MGKPTTWKKNQVLDRTKVLPGPRTQTYGETNYLSKSSFGQNQGIAWSSDSNLWGNQLLMKNFKLLNPRTKHQKKVKATKVIRKMAKRLIIQQLTGAVHFGYTRVIISYTASGIPSSPRLSLGHTTHFSGRSFCIQYPQYVYSSIFYL